MRRNDWYYEIADIRMKAGYSQVIRTLALNRSLAEEQIAKIKYSPLAEDDVVSNIVRVPSIVLPFYYWIVNSNEIPTPDQLIKAHGKLYSGRRSILKADWDYSETNVRHRVMKAYPSLVRDFHAYLLFSEQLTGPGWGPVSYSIRKDILDKTDITLTYQDKEWQVRIFVDTEKAKMWESTRAYSTNEDYAVPICVELGNGSHKVGDLYLLDERHCEGVRKAVETTKAIDV